MPSLIAVAVLSALILLVDGAQASEPEDPHPPNLAASVTWLPDADFASLGSGAGISGKEHQLSLGLFRFDAADTVFDIGIDYEYVRYSYTNVASRNRDLHRLQVPALFETELDGWRLEGFVAPAVSTSSNVFKDYLNRGSSDDAFVSARATMHRGDTTTEWFFGVAYDRSFGEPRTYPVGGVELMPTPALRIRLAFPDPGFAVQVSERQSLQGRVFPAGHQWRVASDDFSRAFDYRVEALRAQLTWSKRIWRQLSVDLSAGYETGREHHFANNAGATLGSEIAGTWLFAAGIRLGEALLPHAHGARF